MSASPLREQIEFRKPTPAHQKGLADFFAALVASDDHRTFHPHPFTPAAAEERSAYDGNDVYCIVTIGERVLGYGMLRGWDQGFTTPSLGIAIHPDARGLGLGRALMNYLHLEAGRRRSPRIRLKVYPDNQSAIALYRSLGYVFEDGLDQGQRIAFKHLGRGSAP